jgi:hypothetical protein
MGGIEELIIFVFYGVLFDKSGIREPFKIFSSYFGPTIIPLCIIKIPNTFLLNNTSFFLKLWSDREELTLVTDDLREIA